MPKKGSENLIPGNKRSQEELRKNGQKGGKASGKARREKKALRETFQMLLAAEPNLTPEQRKKLTNLGIDPDDADNQTMMAIACFKQAMKGDVRAMNLVIELLDEKPSQKVEITNNSFVEALNNIAPDVCTEEVANGDS